ncbi:MAG: hypothetical protein K2O39_01455, partial [Clostridiales bacterium]|nr:hypothetical protein [Clostridiales bacterium]
MKKRRLWLVVLSLIIAICTCFCLAACGGTDEGGKGGNKGDDNKPNVSTLAAPTITIDIDGEATWGEVTNASGYAFKINDGDEQTAENREVQLENAQSVAVKAKGDGVNYADSEWSTAKTYKAPADNLSAPENLTVAIQGTDAGKVILSWNAVQGANAYRYAINGPEQNAVTVEENSVTVDLSKIDASKLDETWVFQVKAIGNDSEADSYTH